MRHHDLKCHPSAFAAVKSGQKRHEVRVNDRDYMAGDAVVLREWDPADKIAGLQDGDYTGESATFTIGHVTQGGTWGLPPKICVFTLLEPSP